MRFISFHNPQWVLCCSKTNVFIVNLYLYYFVYRDFISERISTTFSIWYCPSFTIQYSTIYIYFLYWLPSKRLFYISPQKVEVKRRFHLENIIFVLLTLTVWHLSLDCKYSCRSLCVTRIKVLYTYRYLHAHSKMTIDRKIILSDMLKFSYTSHVLFFLSFLIFNMCFVNLEGTEIDCSGENGENCCGMKI